MTVTSGGVTETYAYNADGARVMRTRSGVTQYYLDGLFERDGAMLRASYQFNGVIIGQRTGSAAAVYLHGDHLGSVSLTTDVSGVASTPQQFDPWGKIRSGTLTATTKRNYTGQILDDTGLLFYNARYYDPVLGRFISADSIVPGNASGGLDGIALKLLTVDFHEPKFGAQLAKENQQPHWFQMDDQQRQQAGSPWGPANPQVLNRYSYTLNNPVEYTDASGHFVLPIIVVVVVVAILVSGALVAVNPSTNSGYDMSGVDWTSWPIPELDITASVESLLGRVYEAKGPRDKGGDWEKRKTTDGETVRVRRLSDEEVRKRGLHLDKQGQGYSGRTAVYEDENHNTYVGGRNGGPIEPEF